MRKFGMVIVYILSTIVAYIAGALTMYVTVFKWMDEVLEDKRIHRKHRYYDEYCEELD